MSCTLVGPPRSACVNIGSFLCCSMLLAFIRIWLQWKYKLWWLCFPASVVYMQNVFHGCLGQHFAEVTVSVTIIFCDYHFIFCYFLSCCLLKLIVFLAVFIITKITTHITDNYQQKSVEWHYCFLISLRFSWHCLLQNKRWVEVNSQKAYSKRSRPRRLENLP